MKLKLLVGIFSFSICSAAFAYTDRDSFRSGLLYAWQQCVAEKCPTGCWDRKAPLTKECMDSDSVPPPCNECDYLVDVFKSFEEKS